MKVLLSREQAEQLLAALPADIQLASANPKEDLQQRGFIFTQDSNGVRVDLLLADLGFDEVAIKRGSALEPLPGLELVLCTPEDLLVYKLISTRAYDHEDARQVVLRQGNKLDHQYVEDWLRQFELALDDSTLVQAYRKLRQAIGK